MHLGLKDLEKALLAHLLTRLWPLDQGFADPTELA